MPKRTLRLCPTVGCPGLWDGEKCTVCDRKPKQHGWKADRERGTRTERGYDNRWLRVRAWKLRQQPLCEECGIRPATEVHHKQPFKGRHDPLRLAYRNLESLCKRCHQNRTAQGRGG